MKKLSKLAILISAFTLSTAALADDHAHHNHHDMHHGQDSQIMMLMHKPMMDVEFVRTTNVDADFIENMIPHHKGAVLSAQELLKTTKNKELIALCNNIIKSQEAEIKEFTELLAELKKKNTVYKNVDSVKFGNEMLALMDKMMVDMSKVQVSGNDDKDFLLGMIPHHQGAVDVSKKILTVTKDKKIIEIANRIINAQEKEIKEMNSYLAKIK